MTAYLTRIQDDTMRILLLGNTGQLGWELQRTIAPLGEVIVLDYPEIDLTHDDSVVQTVRSVRPQLIVNATAYTAVDRAESEPEIAMAVNGRAPGLLAEEALALGAALIHIYCVCIAIRSASSQLGSRKLYVSENRSQLRAEYRGR